MMTGYLNLPTLGFTDSLNWDLPMATSDAYAHGQDSETITGEQGIMREGEVMVTTTASAAPTPTPRGHGRPQEKGWLPFENSRGRGGFR